MIIFKVFASAYLLSTIAYGAQIFAIAPMYGRSHWNVMDAVLQTLVAVGHNVTVVTPFIKAEQIVNYTQVDSSSYLERSASVPFELAAGSNGIQYLTQVHQDSCLALYESEKFWDALGSVKYDLFITQVLGSGCDSYIAYKLRVPMIVVTTSAMPTWFNDPFANPLLTSYSSTLNIPIARPKTFWDRLLNTFDYAYTHIIQWWCDRSATKIGRTYFGKDAPDAQTLMKQISLVFVNSYFAFDLPRPWTTNLIEIGGIHVADPKPLPEDIQRFIDDAPNGIIYFSFGSVVKMDSLPTKMQVSLQEAFAELPQRVLWKYDGDVMKNQPKNVMIKKWFPQRDIMAHPKLKLFVYHGGLSGINEALVNRVPILGIPLFSDQPRNIANVVHLEIGLSLDYKTLDKQLILAAVREIINNDKYKKNILELNRIFNDRPMSPKALVAYWTDYVIKHNGAEHMQSTAIHMPWYKHNLLDIVLCALLVLISLLIIVLYFLLKIKITVIKILSKL